MMKPIRLWLFPEGPNPLKVMILLEELQIPYEIERIRRDNVKTKRLTDLNPNGRVPVIEDLNNDFVLWESGAILTYLVDEYDKDKNLTYTTSKEKHLVNQWLHFQVSGQGPYFGQAAWFMAIHPEKLPSAIQRYQDEIRRVLGVLERHLEGKQWLVGDKMTFADLAWVPYNDGVGMLLGSSERSPLKDYPNVESWHGRMTSRPSWKQAVEKKTRLLESV